MGRLGEHRRVVAWLAFVAIWLTIVAPVVSRVMPVQAAMPAMAGMACPEHMGHATDPGTPHPHPPSTEKCGYCTLIGHSPVLATAAWVPALLPQTAFLPAAFPDESHVRRHSLLAPTSRGPPGFLNA